MSRRRAVVTSSGARTSPEEIRDEKEEEERDREGTSPALVVGRSGFLWLALLVLLLNGSWAVYHFQYESLPSPLNAAQAGKRGFSEALAMEHVKYLTSLGPHPVGSSALDVAVQYVFAAAEKIKKTAHWEVDVQVDLYHSRTGVNSLRGGFFKGKTLIYSDLKHVVLKILPKYHAEAEEKIILVSSHIDTVFSTEGAGDCSSCIAVMLELARGVSQWAHGFKQGVIFLFNTGEEEGLNGAHSFITQHPWASHVKLAIDLEAMGIGGKSTIFQVGASRWPIETYAKVSKYPSGQVIAQDLFLSGAIQSATDFQVYQELVGLPGLDFAYTDATAVYHTKNDKLKLLKPGSLQHLGENMLAFLIHSSMSSNFSKELEIKREENSHQNQHIFFDILGMYMVVYPQHLASTFHNSVILQSLLLWTVSLFMGGYRGSVSFGLSFLSIVLTWAFSLSFSIVVALIISLISATPVPYVAHPWLIIGLFGAPALLGALSGQHLGFSFIVKYLRHSFSLGVPRLPPNIQEKIIKLEAERWIFKAGFIQWMILLIVGNYYKAGCSYMALVWLVSPAFAYGLMEATLSPIRAPKQLKVATLILGLIAPIVFSAGIIIRLVATVIGIIVRSERNPGSIPEWFANVVVAVIVSTVVCLMLVYLLSYYHLSGAKGLVIISLSVLLVLSLAAVSTGIIRPYTEEISRTINVVHVVETKGNYDENQEPRSFISLFSSTPGKLLEEVKDLKDEDFTCGETWSVDFVSFTVKYGCWSFKDVESGWHKSDIPVVHVESDSVSSDVRTTRLFIDTRISKRWSLAINKEEIRDFTFEVDSEELIQLGDKSNVDGWHTIQFSGGMNAPTKFHMNLIWTRNETFHYQEAAQKEGSPPLLKLRTDVNRNTPKVQRILDKLPPWCSLFGKMTSPYTLAFLTTLPVDI